MKITMINRFLFLVAITILSGCSEKFEYEQDISRSNHLYEYLLAAGFKAEDVSPCGDYFILEDDWVIPATEVQRLADLGQNNVHYGHNDNSEGVMDRQRVSGTVVVSMANVVNIKVFVDPSMSNVNGVDFRPWINLALARWSQSNSGAKINFSYVSSHTAANLTIIRNDAGAGLVGNPVLPTCLSVDAEWSVNALARSLYPAEGNVGRFLAIRSNFVGNNNKRVNVLMHEIGHVLGFRHNDSAGESNLWCGLTMQNILLNKTPDVDDDSVMNSVVDENNTDLSANDQLAARLLYPPSYTTPNIVSVTQYSQSLNKVTITPVSPFYYRVGLEVSRVSDGVIISTQSWNAVSNFEYPIWRPTTPGLYRVRLYGENYGGDFQSNWSAYFNFTI